MKKWICILLLPLSLNVSAQQTPAPRLVVRGDDMGYTHSGNLALIRSYKEGFETSIEVLVPSPWFPEAVKLLKENPGADIGVHLALTSEWENIKWRPLTECRSLRDSNGYFYPMVTPNKNYPGQSVSEHAWQLKDIEQEFRAQIETAKRLIPQLSHISAHMGCTNLSAEVKALVIRLAKEYRLITELDLPGVEHVSYDGPHQKASDKVQSFINMLTKLEPGKSYIFLDHPGLNDAELQAVFHIGYEDVNFDRQGVTDLFINPQVRIVIKTRGIQLIGYKDLAPGILSH